MDDEDEQQILTCTIPPAGIDRLDAWLANQCDGFSRARIQGLMKSGLVAVNGIPATRGSAKTHAGDIVTVAVPPPVPAEPEPEDIPLNIVFEDDDLIVIDKPAGIVVHPAPGHLTGTIVNALLHHCPRLSGIGGVARPGIVHRLDQDTSGLLVVAKSQPAMDGLTRAFASHTTIAKTYLAIVHGTPRTREGRIENLIGRCPFDRKKMAVVTKNGKIAITNYRVLSSVDGLSLISCRIETGRTHQIRVHMASTLDCPIAGDAVYGRPGWDRRLTPAPTRQLLHAWHLEFWHPVTNAKLAFEAAIPADFLPYAAVRQGLTPG